MHICPGRGVGSRLCHVDAVLLILSLWITFCVRDGFVFLALQSLCREGEHFLLMMEAQVVPVRALKIKVHLKMLLGVLRVVWQFVWVSWCRLF